MNRLCFQSHEKTGLHHIELLPRAMEAYLAVKRMRTVKEYMICNQLEEMIDT